MPYPQRRRPNPTRHATVLMRLMFATSPEGNHWAMIILGIICLIIAAIFNISFLWWIGALLVLIGVLLWIAGAVGDGIGGRRHYY